jgi:hypothetical protein
VRDLEWVNNTIGDQNTFMGLGWIVDRLSLVYVGAWAEQQTRRNIEMPFGISDTGNYNTTGSENSYFEMELGLSFDS